MRKLLDLSANKALIIILLLAIVFTSLGTYINNLFIPKATRLITVTILLTFYFCQLEKMKRMYLNIFILFFLGDALSVFDFGLLTIHISKVIYLVGYVMLMYVLIKKHEKISFEGHASIYLILVLLLNSYFLFKLFEIATENYIDIFSLALYVIHGVVLISAVFFAFSVYLNKETEQSITFLIMTFCFVFSDVLNYICNLYVYYWVFEMFERILHIFALFLLYKYVLNEHSETYENKHIHISDYFIPTTKKLKEIWVNF
jgi:hypothetical protein